MDGPTMIQVTFHLLGGHAHIVPFICHTGHERFHHGWDGILLRGVAIQVIIWHFCQICASSSIGIQLGVRGISATEMQQTQKRLFVQVNAVLVRK